MNNVRVFFFKLINDRTENRERIPSFLFRGLWIKNIDIFILECME